MILSDICEVYSGYALKDFNDSTKGFPVIKIGNILANGTIDLTSCQYTEEKINKKYYSNNGDIYIALSGATTGKIGVLNSNDRFVVNQRVGIVRKKKNDVPNDFIKYYLLRQTNRIMQEAAGCAQPNISPKQIAQYVIPELDVNEMNQVVEVLNKLEVIILLRTQELCLLNTLIKARFVEMFGDPSLNSRGYHIKHLSEIAEYWNGLTYKPEDVVNNGTIVLRSSNIQNAQLDFEDIVRVNCPISEKKYVQENDILMCSRNGSARLVGKVALIKNVKEPMSFGAFMMIIRSKYYPYLMTYFQMPAFRTQITTGATTTINQITGKMLDEIILPVPRLSELDNYLSFVQQVDKSKFVKINLVIYKNTI